MFERQRGIAARHRMADAIGFGGIEEQDLVRFRHRLVAAQMPGIDAAIGKHQFGGAGAFLRALVPASSGAADVANA